MVGVHTYVDRVPDHVVNVVRNAGLVEVTMSEQTWLALGDEDACDWYYDNAYGWPDGARDLREAAVYRDAWEAPLADQDGFEVSEEEAKAETAAVLAEMDPETRRLLDEVGALLRR
jgi:hypothetical protein